MDYKLMGTDEDSYYIEFSTEQGAVDWLGYMKEKFPEYIERNGIHIVKSKGVLERDETLRLIELAKAVEWAIKKHCWIERKGKHLVMCSHGFKDRLLLESYRDEIAK